MKQLPLSKLQSLFAAMSAAQKLYIPADDAAGQASYFPMKQSLRQARVTRKLLPPFYPIMPGISAPVRKWTDRSTRICRNISSDN